MSEQISNSIYSENVRPIVAAILALDDREFREVQTAVADLAANLIAAKRRNFSEGDEASWTRTGKGGVIVTYVGRVVGKGPIKFRMVELTKDGVDSLPHSHLVDPQDLSPVIHTKDEGEATTEPATGDGGTIVEVSPGLTVEEV